MGDIAYNRYTGNNKENQQEQRAMKTITFIYRNSGGTTEDYTMPLAKIEPHITLRESSVNGRTYAKANSQKMMIQLQRRARPLNSKVEWNNVQWEVEIKEN